MVAHLEHRLSWATIGAEVGDAVFNRILPLGIHEVSNAMYHGWAGYTPYSYALKPLKPIESPGHGVHGPEPSVEERAAKQLEFEEAKTSLRKERAIDKEVSTMTPEDQKIARAFLAPAEKTQDHERNPKMPIGKSLAQVGMDGLTELQSAALGQEFEAPLVDAPEIEAASMSGPEIEAPSMSGQQIEAPDIQPMEMPEMEIE